MTTKGKAKKVKIVKSKKVIKPKAISIKKTKESKKQFKKVNLKQRSDIKKTVVNKNKPVKKEKSIKTQETKKVVPKKLVNKVSSRKSKLPSNEAILDKAQSKRKENKNQALAYHITEINNGVSLSSHIKEKDFQALSENDILKDLKSLEEEKQNIIKENLSHLNDRPSSFGQYGHQMSWDPFQTPDEVPYGYLKDRIVLMIIDPKMIFVYWEINEGLLNAGRNFVGYDSDLVLRIYDVTYIDSFNGYNAHYYWDIPVYDRIGNWYVRLSSGNKVFVVDIGLKNKRGDFYTLVRSNFSQVPKDYISDDNKIYWMTVNEEGQVVITEVEDFTEEDLALLRRMLGEAMFRRLLKGTLIEYLESSAIKRIFKEVPGIENIEVEKQVSSQEFSLSSHSIQIFTDKI